MLQRLLTNRQLAVYFVLTAIDRLLLFFIPVVVLVYSNDVNLYNDVEYIYAAATILAIPIDLGIKNYIFYAYKTTNNKSELLATNSAYIYSLASTYAVAFLVVLVWHFIAPSTIEINIIACIWLRVIYTVLVAFCANYSRLVDRPSEVYKYTMIVSLATVLLLSYLSYVGVTMRLPEVFFFQAVGVLLLLVKTKRHGALGQLGAKVVNNFFCYIRKSLSYAWPLMLNTFLVVVVLQYGKIHAYNFLPDGEMTKLSLLQRSGMVIIFFHIAIQGFFSKKIFMGDELKSHTQVFSFYITILIISTILAYLLMLTLGNYSASASIDVSFTLFAALAIANLCWCVTAYLELYYNRMNKNKYIIVIASVSIFLFFVSLFAREVVSVDQIIFSMLIGNIGALFTSIVILSSLHPLQKLRSSNEHAGLN